MLSLLSSPYKHFRDTLLYGRDTIKLEDVQETLLSKESINGNINGSTSKNQGDGLVAHEKKYQQKL